MNDFMLSLQITMTGMGLVFGAIIVLWGLMALLTALIRDKEAQPEVDQPAPVQAVTEPAGLGTKARAAAVAVSLALAEQEASSAHPLPPPPTTIVGAWQLGMRTRQMTQKGNSYKKEHQ
jgi:Na+-transporting methylmalonyl-CoA/oxaloacetate decarboxylase gamma subunit